MLRLNRSTAILVCVSLAALICGGCGSKDSPTAVSPAPSTTTTTLSYVAIVAIPDRDGKSGVLTLTTTVQNGSTQLSSGSQQATAPAIGSLVTPNNTWSMNGSYDTTTKQFTVSGGGYQLSATVSDDGTALSGAGTQAAEPGLEVMVAGVVSSAASPSQAYCGTSDGLYCYREADAITGIPLGYCESEKSSFRFVIAGAGSGNAHSLQGTSSSKEGNARFSGTATIVSGTPANMGSGSSISFTLSSGPGAGGYGGGSGSCGGECYGGYTGGDNNGTSRGTWNANKCS